jgi:hypothetical protein
VFVEVALGEIGGIEIDHALSRSWDK